jgi:uncharacterized protein YukJ
LIEGGDRFYIFGEPLGSTGSSHHGSSHRGSAHGVHNIHQNQGNEIGGGNGEENGIWQDGAVVVQKADGRLVGCLNRFTGQADSTDDSGSPNWTHLTLWVLSRHKHPEIEISLTLRLLLLLFLPLTRQ